MPKNIFYAMEPSSLKSYIDHKNNMQAAATLLTSDKIEKIKSEVSGIRMADNGGLGSGKTPRNYSVDNGVATIAIAGPLEPKADLCAILFDVEMTTYSDIINSINLAENDNSVETIVFEINSPGGNVVGLSRTAEKIKNATKPTKAVVSDMAASAAYWLASQADSIVAEHSAVEIGSIGVFCQYINTSESDKQLGVERKSFRSANAPLKNADPFTAEGEKQVVERITNLESVFFDYISSGRQVSVEDIKENYGKGAVLIAGDALEAGMIDAIESISKMDTPIQKNNNNNNDVRTGDDSMGKIEMTQEELDSAISKAALSGAKQALSANATEVESKLAADKKESERVAGFTSLIAGFPKQNEMIKSEMDKGNSATADFAMKVSSAEQTRLKVEAEADTNDKTKVPDLKAVDKTQDKPKLNAVAEMCIKGRA